MDEILAEIRRLECEWAALQKNACPIWPNCSCENCWAFSEKDQEFKLALRKFMGGSSVSLRAEVARLEHELVELRERCRRMRALPPPSNQKN